MVCELKSWMLKKAFDEVDSFYQQPEILAQLNNKEK